MTLFLVIGILVTVGGALYLIGSMIRSIQVERRSSHLQKVWRHFGLSIAFCLLFLTSWIGQAFTEWGVYKNEQQAHGQPADATGYAFEFLQSTLENWQSEFLQLFSFVVLSALLIHRGSAESKDGDERMEATLQRIERQLKELQEGRGPTR